MILTLKINIISASILLLLISLPSLFSPAYAIEPAIVDDTLTIENISPALEYIEDREEKLKLEDVLKLQKEWIAGKADYVNFGYTYSNFWFRFKISNRSDRTRNFLLEIDFPPIDYIKLYIPDAGGYSVKKAGDSVPFKERDVADRNYFFKIKQAPGERTYYMHIDSVDSINFVINILTGEEYTERLKRELPIYWLYFGLIIVMILYNFFIFFSVRDTAYLYYVLFIISIAFFEFNVKGFAQQYLWPDSTWWVSHANPFFVSNALLWVSLFLDTYIDVKKKYPVLHKWIIFSLVIPSSLLVVYSLVGGVLSSLFFILILALWTICFYLVLGPYLAIFKKPYSREARIALIAFAIFIIAVPIMVLTMNGVLPANFFTRWVMQLGMAILVILLSFGLADKINIMKRELEVLNESLEEKVIERTDELQAAMEEVEAMNENLIIVNTSLEDAEQIRKMDMFMAASIQAKFLPNEIPESAEYDIAYIFQPASEVSGDFYDFYQTNNMLEGVGLFDVSGHGISSGLITLLGKSIIFRHFLKSLDTRLSRVMSEINRELIEEIGQLDNYITGILLRFKGNFIEYVNSGHPDLIYKSGKTGKVKEMLNKSGGSIRGNFLGVKIMEGEFHSLKFELNRNDCLVLYTDCLTETTNPDGNEYENTGVKNSLERASGETAKEILDILLKDFFRFAGKERDFDDDLTMIVIKRC